MLYINCNIETCLKRNKARRVIFFGAGQNMFFAENSRLSLLNENVPYIVDNGKTSSARLWNRDVPIYSPDKLLEESECSVIITSAKYMSEMYAQLESLSLGDSIELYVFPFMLLEEKHPLTGIQREQIFNKGRSEVIPRIIHSFWFSGSEKPIEYQRCIDTWKKYCPGYDIREWNLNNYDGNDHPFFKRAIDVKAWAYATDYARLDVMSRFGGIYMDMDVELIKPLDLLLSHEGVFPFCSDGVIELAMFMATPGNPLVKNLFKIYEELEIPETREGFNKYYQPLVVMQRLVEYGVLMDDSFQEIEGNLFLPKQICMPLDYCLYELNADDDTVAIHRANAGWHEADYTKRRVGANKAVKNKLETIADES